MMSETLLTPPAECIFAKTHVPDRTYKNFEITLIFDVQKPDHKAFLRSLESQVNIHKCSNSPWKQERDEDEVATGRFLVSFRSKFAVNVYDSVGNVIESERNLIGNGSIVRVAFNLSPYADKGKGSGISRYLKAVQVIKLVAYEGASLTGFGFEPITDGFVAPKSENDSPFAGDGASTGSMFDGQAPDPKANFRTSEAMQAPGGAHVEPAGTFFGSGQPEPVPAPTDNDDLPF